MSAREFRYTCPLCHRVLGTDLDDYMAHYKKCVRPVPLTSPQAPQAPLVWPDRTYKLTESDKNFLSVLHIKGDE